MSYVESVLLTLVELSALQKSINLQTANSLVEITKQFDKSARPKILASLEILLTLTGEHSLKFDELVERLKAELAKDENS